MSTEDTQRFLAALQAEYATLLARCEQAEARVEELEAADAANKAAILRDWQFTPNHLQAVRDDATPITSRLRGDYGVRQFPPNALGVVAAERIEQLEATVAACKAAGFVDAKGNVRKTVVEDAIDRENMRWQDRIDAYVYGIDPNRDGAGCDSGDPLDLTETEIVGALAVLSECMDDLLASPKGVVPKSCERFYRDGYFDVAAEAARGGEQG